MIVMTQLEALEELIGSLDKIKALGFNKIAVH